MKEVKNGFTLTEILVVIALLAIIIVVAVPSIFAINNKINEKLYKTKKELIISASLLYAQDINAQNGLSITVNTLLENNYLEEDKEECEGYIYGCIINPIDKSILNSIIININKTNGSYSASSSWGV